MNKTYTNSKPAYPPGFMPDHEGQKQHVRVHLANGTILYLKQEVQELKLRTRPGMIGWVSVCSVTEVSGIRRKGLEARFSYREAVLAVQITSENFDNVFDTAES